MITLAIWRNVEKKTLLQIVFFLFMRKYKDKDNIYEKQKRETTKCDCSTSLL